MSEEIRKLFPKDMKYIDTLPIANYIEELQQENKQLKDIRETAINYIDQVIMYKSCAREIDEELNTLIGILRGV